MERDIDIAFATFSQMFSKVVKTKLQNRTLILILAAIIVSSYYSHRSQNL